LLRTDGDALEVGPKDGGVPDARLLVEAHVADQLGARRDPRRLGDGRLDALERQQHGNLHRSSRRVFSTRRLVPPTRFELAPQRF